MILNLHSNRLRAFTISIVSRLLVLFILSSFAVTQLPIAITSADSSMPCCADRSAEHCDSGLMAPKHRPVITEEMCGLPAPVETKSHDHSLLKAETASHHADAHNADAESNASQVTTAESISQPCRMDCAACATTTLRQQKRQKSFVTARTANAAPSLATLQVETRTLFFATDQFWTRINPRGPPSELL
jgi:hypothetical protein